MSFSPEQKASLLKIARTAAQKYLDSGGKRQPLSATVATAARVLGLAETCGGCFVTYKRQGRLRGCVGVFLPPEPLYEVVASRAIAALEDSRFAHNKITAREFREQIDLCVSVLSFPVRTKEPLRDLVVGVHGVLVSKGSRSGTYLPEVAVEQGWDARTFLMQCAIEKAGIDAGGADPLTDPLVKWKFYTTESICEVEEVLQEKK